MPTNIFDRYKIKHCTTLHIIAWFVSLLMNGSVIINFSSYNTTPHFSCSKQHVRYSGQAQRVSQVKKI